MHYNAPGFLEFGQNFLVSGVWLGKISMGASKCLNCDVEMNSSSCPFIFEFFKTQRWHHFPKWKYNFRQWDTNTGCVLGSSDLPIEWMLIAIHNQFFKSDTLFQWEKRASNQKGLIFWNCDDMANDVIKKVSSFISRKSCANNVGIHGNNIDGSKCVFDPFLCEWSIKIDHLWKRDLLFWIHWFVLVILFLWNLIVGLNVKSSKRLSSQNCDSLVCLLWRVSIHWWELINLLDGFWRKKWEGEDYDQ